LTLKADNPSPYLGKAKMPSEDMDEFERDMAHELESAMSDGGIEWENEVVPLMGTVAASDEISISSPGFVEDMTVRAQVTKLLNKAARARHVFFRYEYAVKVCLRALDLVTDADYPDDHPLVTKALQSLNTAHHALSSYQNSANIVRMGIRYEDAGELVRALKMFSIAYRIRRDHLSTEHPSLVVLLNMLGSVQMKRDELEEAMEIFEIAVKDDLMIYGADTLEGVTPVPSNLLARGVAYREMGSIYERWHEPEEALAMYNKSLECVAQLKGITLIPPSVSQSAKIGAPQPHEDDHEFTSHHAILLDLENVKMNRPLPRRSLNVVKANKHESDEHESAGMEMLIGHKRMAGSRNARTFLEFRALADTMSFSLSPWSR
jgi:tetratricopeptide (TPR) repeat protein